MSNLDFDDLTKPPLNYGFTAAGATYEAALFTWGDVRPLKIVNMAVEIITAAGTTPEFSVAHGTPGAAYELKGSFFDDGVPPANAAGRRVSFAGEEDDVILPGEEISVRARDFNTGKARLIIVGRYL